jgi:hypothetical protein
MMKFNRTFLLGVTLICILGCTEANSRRVSVAESGSKDGALISDGGINCLELDVMVCSKVPYRRCQENDVTCAPCIVCTEVSL